MAAKIIFFIYPTLRCIGGLQQHLQKLRLVIPPHVGFERRQRAPEDGTVVLVFLALTGLNGIQFLTIREYTL